MFLAHSFRLRDPWQCECMLEGATRWSRVFHRPTGLEDDDALWLVCSGLPEGAEVTLNGIKLSAECHSPRRVLPPHQYEVTALLADTNKLELLVSSDLQPPASSLQPDSPFPYDVRLGVIGHS